MNNSCTAGIPWIRLSSFTVVAKCPGVERLILRVCYHGGTLSPGIGVLDGPGCCWDMRRMVRWSRVALGRCLDLRLSLLVRISHWLGRPRIIAHSGLKLRAASHRRLRGSGSVAPLRVDAHKFRGQLIRLLEVLRIAPAWHGMFELNR